VLTALVVDDSAGARKRVATLLRLGGWEVHQAVGVGAALAMAEDVQPDLVVTDFVMRGGNGAALLHRLRNEGCRARTIVVAAQLTEQVREYAAAAGAMACLAKPVHPRELLDVMHALTGNVVRRPQPVASEPIRIEAERLDQVKKRYVSDLPLHLTAIAASAQEGDSAGVAAAAQNLAAVSSQVGQAEVAWICSTIAAEANRGVVAHARMMQLVALSASAHGGRRSLAG
jgi:DNA-binding response OmpR family regulator